MPTDPYGDRPDGTFDLHLPLKGQYCPALCWTEPVMSIWSCWAWEGYLWDPNWRRDS